MELKIETCQSLRKPYIKIVELLFKKENSDESSLEINPNNLEFFHFF